MANPSIEDDSPVADEHLGADENIGRNNPTMDKPTVRTDVPAWPTLASIGTTSIRMRTPVPAPPSPHLPTTHSTTELRARPLSR